MKTRQSRRQTAKISHSRWVAYATAGAATALVGSNSLEAAIHYSGRVGVPFPPHGVATQTIKTFQLDQPADFFRFFHSSEGGFAGFNIVGADRLQPAGVRGISGFDVDYVSKLSFGQNISAGSFVEGYPFDLMAFGYVAGQWLDPGVGFVGFRFNSGAGYQYGWARVFMGGASRTNAFKLIDYAYADPGEAIRAGEGIPRAGEDGQDMSKVPDEGSLGWLALGAVGLLAWRKSRSRTAS